MQRRLATTKSWRAIRAELDRVLEDRERIPPFHAVSADQYDMSNDGKWKTFFLYGYRNRVEDIRFGDVTFEGASIIGTSAILPEIREVITTEGRFFTEQEEHNKQFVCVIGTDVQAKFFGDASPGDEDTMAQSIHFIPLGRAP